MIRISATGLNIIKHWEGLRLESYLCPAGVWTIGYGSTRIDGEPVKPGMKITKERAEELLRKTIVLYESAVNKYVVVKLNQNQFDALTSLCYNIGPGRFRDSKLVELLNKKKYKEASKEIKNFNKARVKGKLTVLPGLAARRKMEEELFNSPCYEIDLMPEYKGLEFIKREGNVRNQNEEFAFKIREV